MPSSVPQTHSFDLGGLRLASGEGRRLDLAVAVDPFELGGERYDGYRRHLRGLDAGGHVAAEVLPIPVRLTSPG